jgi:hypothetical protein
VSAALRVRSAPPTACCLLCTHDALGGACVLKIEQEHTDDGYTVCRPVGELDAFPVNQVCQALAELATGLKRVCVRLRRTTQGGRHQ